MLVMLVVVGSLECGGVGVVFVGCGISDFDVAAVCGV